MGRCNSERDLYLFCAGWTRRFGVVSCSAHLSQAQESCLRSWLEFIFHFLSSSSSSVDLAPTEAKLGSLKRGHAGQVVVRGSSLVVSMVGPAWPRNELTEFFPVVRFSDGEFFE